LIIATLKIIYVWSNTKLLVSASLLITVLGISLLWFGLQPLPVEQPNPLPAAIPITESLPTATASISPSASSSATQGLEGERVLVTEVIDGDTIRVNSSLTVRLLGIDTPETVDPRRPVGCFGKEASNETKELLSGRGVILQKDVSEVDKYKRLLRYVFLPLQNGQTLFVNDYLVREGFAKVLTYPPDVKYNEQFRQAEKEAKEGRKGLWGRCY